MSKLVLVADKHGYWTQLLADRCAENDITLRTTDNALTAYKIFCEERPACIILEHDLLEMTGPLLVTLLAQEDHFRTTHIIVYTHHTLEKWNVVAEQINSATWLNKAEHDIDIVAKALLARINK